jgi:hypothetical protein
MVEALLRVTSQGHDAHIKLADYPGHISPNHLHQTGCFGGGRFSI